MKTHPMSATSRRFVSVLIAIAFTMSWWGCGASGLLSSNLYRYDDGTSLALTGSNIPGAPDGDRVLNVLPAVVVTANGTDLMDGNALRVNGSVDYRLRDHAVPDRYQVVWRGLRDNHASTRTHIRLRDASGRNALVLRFEDDRLTVRSEDEDDNPQPFFATKRVHEVSIVLNMNGDRTVRVTVTEDGEQIFTPLPLGLLDPDFTSLHTVQIESASGVNYFVQRLNVIEN